MLFSHTTFIGIDPTAGQKPFTYAALDNNLRLLALGQGNMEEVLAFAGGQQQAFVAASAPRRTAQGVLKRPEVRQMFKPPPRSDRWSRFRMAEYQLRQYRINCPPTGAEESTCAGWVRNGFKLYQRLEEMNYQPFPAESELQWLETYPHACYCALLGMTPFSKDTFEGRVQRQLILYDQKLHIANPMSVFEEITRHRLLQGIMPLDVLHSPDELDALVAAYTAWVAATHPNQITTLGHPDEGLVVLPVKELKHRYSTPQQ